MGDSFRYGGGTLKKLRLLSLLLVGLLLLASCAASSGTPANPTEAATTTGTANEPEPLRLAEGGKAVYQIVYPYESAFGNLSVWVDQIKKALKKECGVDFTAYHDGQTAQSEYLILLGDTRYAESTEAAGRLGIGGYSVSMEGKRIVITARDELSMVKAVNWFCNTLLKAVELSEDGKEATLVFSEKLEKGEAADQPITIAGYPLEEFGIVYPANNEEGKAAAAALRTAIAEKLGVLPKLSSDQAREEELEILVGLTNRAESRTHLAASSVEPMQYEYCVVGKKLSIIGYGGNGYSLTTACRLLLDSARANGMTTLKEGDKMNGKVELKPDSFAELTPGADVRIMTANILSEEWGGTECLPRAEILYANLMYYHPDVIGVQECSLKWTEALHTVLEGSSYTVLYEKVPGTDTNYCPILYNQSTLELVDSGAYQLRIGGPAKARTVTWGVFRVKTSGKCFIVLNTHLDWTKTPDDLISTGPTTPYSRELQVRELAATFAELEEKYPGYEIMMTADWNTMKNAHPLDVLVELTGVKYAEDMVPGNQWGNEVDHIFLQADTKALALHLYRENATDLGASDHPWGFVDVALR